MKIMAQDTGRVKTKASVRSGRIRFLLIFLISIFSTVSLSAQCPNTGETKVFKSKKGTGFYFYKFIGDSSYSYFLEGKAFSFNDKDDPGKTFIFIDDMAYEPILVKQSDLAKYVNSTDAMAILRAQAKHEQDYFKSVDSSMVITDLGEAYTKKPDGSNDRLFYLWKKENPKGKKDATQYLCSTLIKDGLVVMSFISPKAPISEEDMIGRIQNYTSHFVLLSNAQCATALSAPVAP